MLYGRLPLSLRNVNDLLLKRGIDFNHETVRFWKDRCSSTADLLANARKEIKGNIRNQILSLEKVGPQAHPLRHIQLIRSNSI